MCREVDGSETFFANVFTLHLHVAPANSFLLDVVFSTSFLEKCEWNDAVDVILHSYVKQLNMTFDNVDRALYAASGKRAFAIYGGTCGRWRHLRSVTGGVHAASQDLPVPPIIPGSTVLIWHFHWRNRWTNTCYLGHVRSHHDDDDDDDVNSDASESVGRFVILNTGACYE